MLKLLHLQTFEVKDMEKLDDCELCKELNYFRKVNPIGNSPFWIIGEAPGKDEERTGIPFVGKSGMLLNSTLGKAGTDRTAFHITNILKCRPPNNRTPKDVERKNCMKWLEIEFTLHKPLCVLLLGSTSANAFGITQITKSRGKVYDKTIGGITFKAIPTYHPSYVMRLNTVKVNNEFLSDIKTFLVSCGIKPVSRITTFGDF